MIGELMLNAVYFDALRAHMGAKYNSARHLGEQLNAVGTLVQLALQSRNARDAQRPVGAMMEHALLENPHKRPAIQDLMDPQLLPMDPAARANVEQRAAEAAAERRRQELERAKAAAEEEKRRAEREKLRLEEERKHLAELEALEAQKRAAAVKRQKLAEEAAAARRKAEEAEVRLKAEEEARRKEAEAQRKAAEAQRKAAEEARRQEVGTQCLWRTIDVRLQELEVC